MTAAGAEGGPGCRRGLDLAPFDELSDPALLIDLAVAAEHAGWDGVFLWDHLRYTPPVRELADPWVALSAIAARTNRIRLGPLVTPLARRRIEKVARETVTLDRLSGGRLVLGVGLGSDRHGELSSFGEVLDPKQRAQILDAGLEQLARYWSGELLPRPVQRPRIPVWVGGTWPHQRPLRRALRWDGFFPDDVPGPAELAQVREAIGRGGRDVGDHFTLVAQIGPGDDPGPWVAAGATWVLTQFGMQPDEQEVRRAIAAGP